ncbi:hypothetical protein EHS25_009908 [Saitozyma podzolica]|uniref:Uncharacterized protein n=1 Tax=Saitozyma podzolica TaxID=1890683 RepID=A0A427YI28_9TREE|nr:hypothetical protein EHS25_009908 [Saitozyma podzolica]
MFLNINRVKIVFLDNTETTAGWDVQHYGLPPDGIRMGGIAPLHAEDLVSIIRRAQRHGRILELYGLEELRFEWGYSSRTRSGVIDDEALLKRIRDELERGNVVLKNSEAHLIIGTEDEYWTGHDWKGEVTQQEIATRIRDRRWVREERRRNARWMEAREDLRAQFDAGKLEDELWTPKQRDFEDAEAPYWFYHNDPEGLDQDDEVTF